MAAASPATLFTMVPLAAQEDALKEGLVGIASREILKHFKVNLDKYYKHEEAPIDFRAPATGLSTLFYVVGDHIEYSRIEKKVKEVLKKVLRGYLDARDAADAGDIYEFLLGPSLSQHFREKVAEKIALSRDFFKKPPVISTLRSPSHLGAVDTMIFVESNITEALIKEIVQRSKEDLANLRSMITASIYTSAMADFMRAYATEGMMLSDNDMMERFDKFVKERVSTVASKEHHSETAAAASIG